jgi:hypothetical protein
MTGLLGAPLPIAYDRRQFSAQSDMPAPWLAQLAIETKAPSDYARRQIAFEHMLAAASLDDSD